MARLDFCDKHNMVAYLEKSAGSEGFEQIIDFLSASHIHFALTANPTIYTSLIQQFWETAALCTMEDGVPGISATIDRKVKVLVSEASIRRHLKLEDSEGLSSLPNAEIFEQLANMGLESELKQTKETYNTALTKLILRVKKLEKQVQTTNSRRKTKIVLSKDEDVVEDPSNQGRIIEEIDADTDITLVTPIKVIIQSDQSEDHLRVLSAAKVLAEAAKQGRGVGLTQNYTRRRRNVGNSSDGVNTASESDSTAGGKAKEEGSSSDEHG
ncbi:hypothetical protein Tco_1067675 [Tanacetum coccineum]|uniref:Xylulose kinase-1 n=1 Tax=Tanacetum coccineum TaxID=301880 RepID=A0ABQ5HFN0_9ASTR